MIQRRKDEKYWKRGKNWRLPQEINRKFRTANNIFLEASGSELFSRIKTVVTKAMLLEFAFQENFGQTRPAFF